MEPTKTGIEPICQLCWSALKVSPRLTGKYISAEMKRNGSTLPKHFCKSKKSLRCNKRVDFLTPCEHYDYNPFNQFERHSKTGVLRTKEELERMYEHEELLKPKEKVEVVTKIVCGEKEVCP